MDYKYYNKTVLRTPSKPLKSTFTKDELYNLYKQKTVQEALFLSSPNLFYKCKKWLNGEVTDRTVEEKLIFSLLKYALRMHSRCTPYGLYAGCGVIDNEKNIVINSQGHTRSTRLDMNFTCALAIELAKKPFIQPYLKFYPNTSIYNLHDKFRYVEYYYHNKIRKHQISAVDYSNYLQEVIKYAKKGVTIRQLSELLSSNEIPYEEAEAFLKEIINAQILVSELEPSVTGDELLKQILSVIIKIYKKNPDKNLREIIQLIEDIQSNILTLDNTIGNEINIYEKLVEQLQAFGIPIEKNKLFQTDLFIGFQSQSSNQGYIENNKLDTQKLLTKALKVLNKLSFHNENNDINSFKERFYQRYEDKEMSLSEVLDNESGIGYGSNNNQTGDISPLIDGLAIPNKNLNKSKISFYEKQSFLFKKLIEANKNQQYSITINADDVKHFEENWEDFPDTFGVLYSYIKCENNSDFLRMEYAGGSSAVNLLGRFGDGNKEIEKIIKDVAEHEQTIYSDKIVASILHLPGSRTGNVLLRPIIREYEIPYLSKSSLQIERQIPIDDLMVSIKYNQIILRSRSLDKEIIPRLDNAHNYSHNSLPVYHFLCDIQTKSVQKDIYFDWGPLKNEFSFLPRVEIEGVVVSLATWQLKKGQYKSLLKKSSTDLKSAVVDWQTVWQLPDLVLLADGDKQLLINLTEELSLNMFVAEIKKRDIVILKEFLFDEKTIPVKDENGEVYTNELITILQKEPSLHLSNVSKSKKKPSAIIHKKIPRAFSLGSEWLYYKIYCGVKTADRILTEEIKLLTERLISLQLIDSWFFIRYSDPETHLRIRFHLLDTSKIGEVIQLFYEVMREYQSSGLVWNIESSTYQREVERYGSNTLLLSEQLFYYDSKCTVNFLNRIKGQRSEELRWLFGIKAVDELLSNFNFEIDQKFKLIGNLKTGYAKEFNLNKPLKLQLDKKYRDKRNSIEEILWNTEVVNNDHQFIKTLLNNHYEKITPIIQKIINMKENKLLELTLNNLLTSYIHMILNRLFKNKQRLHEMIIYDYMWRSYRSKLAKEKHLV